MLRDTFAVELLLAGVPIDQVSILLGHASVKTTERHYAPFVKARQEQLVSLPTCSAICPKTNGLKAKSPLTGCVSERVRNQCRVTLGRHLR